MREAPALSRSRRLIYTAIIVLVVLGLLEGVSRLVIGVTPGAHWEYRSKLLVDLGFPMMNELLEPDPELLWRLRPGLQDFDVSGRIADSRPFRFRVSTDDGGLRRMDPVSVPTHRVLFLGDSCIFGLGVDDNQTIPVFVQNHLSGVSCRNAGIPGYSSFQGRLLLESLEDEGPFDIVVVNFGRNDGLWWNNLSDIEQVGIMARDEARWVNRLRLTKLIAKILPDKKTETRTPRRFGQRPRLTDGEFAKELRTIVRLSRQRGAEPVLLIWPMVQQMRQPVLSPKQMVIQEIGAEEKVRVIDLGAVFRDSGGENLFLDVIHVNPEGCRQAAEVLAPVLAQVLERR